MVRGCDWEIDLLQADKEQFVHWWYEHILAICERALNRSSIVLLVGFPLTQMSYFDEIFRYAEVVGELPVILNNTDDLLLLGHPERELDDFWDDKSVNSLPASDECH